MGPSLPLHTQPRQQRALSGTEPPKFMWGPEFHLAGESLPRWSQNWEQRRFLEAPSAAEGPKIPQPSHEPAQCTDLLLSTSNQLLKSWLATHFQ